MILIFPYISVFTSKMLFDFFKQFDYIIIAGKYHCIEHPHSWGIQLNEREKCWWRTHHPGFQVILLWKDCHTRITTKSWLFIEKFTNLLVHILFTVGEAMWSWTILQVTFTLGQSTWSRRYSLVWGMKLEQQGHTSESP